MKKFKLKGKNYFFDYNSASERKVKLFQELSGDDLYGKQKKIIVEKLWEIIHKNPTIRISRTHRDYIFSYHNGTNRDASINTNSLGRILNDYFEGKL